MKEAVDEAVRATAKSIFEEFQKLMNAEPDATHWDVDQDEYASLKEKYLPKEVQP